LEDLTGESAAPLQISGFGVGNYQFDGDTHDNSFDAAKLAVSMFRELSPHLWVFGQLTTSVSPAPPGSDEATTSIEIDNLIVNVTPPGWSTGSIAFGKFDTPLGFERDDEPLNLQATLSDNFTYARPSKMVGVIGRWIATRHVELSAWQANGWQGDL